MHQIHETHIRGHNLRFQDRASSTVVPYIANELNYDVYRLASVVLDVDEVFMDIGANVGMTSILANRIFGCKVVAIEPVPGNFANLEANLDLNGCDKSKFTLINKAAASYIGSIDIDECFYATGNSSAYFKHGNTTSCPTCVVRDLLIEHRPKYLKIDCEGGEWDILPSLDSECLESVKWIGIELHPLPKHDSPNVLLKRLGEVFKGQIILA